MNALVQGASSLTETDKSFLLKVFENTFMTMVASSALFMQEATFFNQTLSSEGGKTLRRCSRNLSGLFVPLSCVYQK